ncbi:MAG: adenine deaminase C-terminal domain-containing protein [Ilumatobacteraceae bacterium]
MATGRIGPSASPGFGALNGAIAPTVAHDADLSWWAVGRPGVREDMPSLRPESLTSAGMVVQDGRGRLTGAAARRPDERSTRGRRHRPPRLDPALPRRRSVSNLENPFAALSFLGSTVVPELRLTDRGLSTVDGRYHRSRVS